MANWLERLLGDSRAKLLGLLRRSRRSVNELADAMDMTDNAVRTHVAVLERDGMVQATGSVRAERGKPARLYEITPEGEELFPKAYALVLGELVEEVRRAEGPKETTELMRTVGRRLAAPIPRPAKKAERVAAAAEALRGLGGDLDVVETSDGWRIQGYGCPLSAVTADHAELCELARTLVQDVTGGQVTECCDRTGRPKCAFEIGR